MGPHAARIDRAPRAARPQGFLDFDLRLEERFFVDLRLEERLVDDFRLDDLRLDEDLRDFFDDFFLGTLPPERRASDSPMAMACLRLFTFLPERPLLSLPRFISCIAFFTFLRDFLPYLAAMDLLLCR